MCIRIFAAVLLAVLGMVRLTPGMEQTAYTAEERPLSAGTVTVFRFPDIVLHAYQTNDQMADQCFLLETDAGLVAVESPAFEEGIAAWQEYCAGLGKPLTDILLSAHPAGGRWYGGAVSHATEAAAGAFASGSVRQLTDSLKDAFGSGFSNDIPAVDRLLGEGPNRIGGIECIIMPDGDGYDLAVPAIGAVYTHMLGADVHSILVCPEHIAAEAAKLQRYRDAGYRLFLSGHHTPETAADADMKIAYLRKTGETAAASADRKAFTAAMKAAFPGHAGENYLGMTAASLFPEDE